jgi:copper resistance protein D
VADAVPALQILLAILNDLSFALIVGTLLASAWLGKDAADSTRLRRMSTVCLAVLLVCHLARPWFVASSMSGTTNFRQALDVVATVLTATRQGSLWYANSLVLAVLIAAQRRMKPRGTSPATGIAIAALVVLAATRAASSHASEAGDFSIAEISQFLHLVATSVWAGAIVVSAFLVVPQWPGFGASTLWHYSRRLSQTVTWALAMLVLTGIYTTWRAIDGTVDVLWTRHWGRILLIKVSLVVLAALLGSLTRFRCVQRPPKNETAALMVRLLWCEALVMAVILAVSGLLANTNPGA